MDMRTRIANQLGALLFSVMEAQQTAEDLHAALQARDAKIAELTPTAEPAQVEAQ